MSDVKEPNKDPILEKANHSDGAAAPGRRPMPRLLHSDPDFLIFYKPEDLSFYEEGKKHDLLKAIRTMEEEGSIPEGERLFPVHRLDRITSGLLLFARGRNNANLLGNEFRHNRIHKVYVALSLHPPKKRHGYVEGDIIKSRRGTYKLTHTTDLPSRSRFTSRSIPDRRPGLRLFLVKPETGKTHQVRVVLKSLGSSILGDPLYDRFDAARAEDRAYLHALALSFRLNGKEQRFFQLPESGSEYLTPQFKQTLESFGDIFALQWPGREGLAFIHEDRRRPGGDRPRFEPRTERKPSDTRKGRPSKRPGRRERQSRNR